MTGYNERMAYDLILRGGRVIDPSQKLDAVCDVAFSGGKVAACGAAIDPAGCADIRDVAGRIVTPGLIDLHTHVYWGGTSIGIDPLVFARENAVTTAVDTGSAGPGNFAGFRAHVIDPCPVRILAYLHVSFAGIFAFSKTIMVGESEELRLMAPREAVEVAKVHRDVIVGIKVRVGRFSSGIHGTAPLDIALQVAEETGLPVMAHIDDPPPSYEEVLARLRPCDILTHAFRPFPNTPVGPDGRVKAAVRDARARGVLFDIGHGKASFAFETGRRMLEHGFLPDTISSDIHSACIDGPVFSQLVTLSKFLALGMSLQDVIDCTTRNAAVALRRPDLGSLAVGSAGDASILSLEQGAYSFVDAVGETLQADRALAAHGVVVGGRWFQG